MLSLPLRSSEPSGEPGDMRADGTRIVYEHLHENHKFTTLKLDMEPENGWLEDKFSCGMADCFLELCETLGV